MTTWTYTFAELRRRPGRTFLTLFGVAIGVAVLVAATTAISAARVAYRDLFDVAGHVDSLEIVASAGSGFRSEIAEGLQSTPGVRSLCPRIVAASALADYSGSTPVRLLGIDASRTSDYGAIRSGQPLASGEGVWLDVNTAQSRHWDVGTTLTLLTPNKQVELPLLGIVEVRGAAGISGSSTAYLSLTQAQRLFRLPNQVNSVGVILAEGTSADEVTRSLTAKLPPGLRVQAASQRGELSRSTLMAVEQGLTALSMVALVTAGFVVLNTMLLNVNERRKQLAILVAVGGTRGQIRRLLLREATLLGCAGAIIGVGLGLLLATGLANALENFLGVTLPSPDPPMWLLGAAILAGPVLTLTATFAAARSAARQSPLRGLLDPTGSKDETGTVRGRLLGIALIAAAGVATVGLCQGWWPGSDLMGPAVAGLLAGSALCLPILILPSLRGLQSLARRLFGINGRLALIQLQRRPERTALTTGVLFIAIASAVGFGHWLLNTLGDLKTWYGNAIVADFFLRGSAPDSSFLMTSPVPEKLENELAELRGVDRLEKMSFVPASVEGHSTLVLARTFAPDRPLTLDLREGDPANVRVGLMRGDVVIASKLAQELNKRIGDNIVFDSTKGPKSLRIAGIVAEYAAGGDAFYLEWKTARELLPDSGVHVFLLSAKSGAREVLRSDLEVFAYRHQLLVQSNADVRGTIDRLLERITASLWVIVVLTFAVGSLGVVNTLTMNVIEQSRDLSLMRAIGMTRSQTRRLVLRQASFIGCLSLIPGAAAGLGLGAVITASANASFGQQVHFHIYPSLVIGSVVVGFLITMLAACIPAKHAVRFAALAVGGKG